MNDEIYSFFLDYDANIFFYFNILRSIKFVQWSCNLTIVVSEKITMSDDVVCISDDEKNPKTKTKKVNFYHNVYEHSTAVPESVRARLEFLDQERRDDTIQKLVGSEQDDIIYVPDDYEEEDLLLSPIRALSHDIIFNKSMDSTRTEFPYGLLEQIEKHLVNSLRNVSFTTEATVWNCVLDQLNCIRFAYDELIDVGILKI